MSAMLLSYIAGTSVFLKFALYLETPTQPCEFSQLIDIFSPWSTLLLLLLLLSHKRTIRLRFTNLFFQCTTSCKIPALPPLGPVHANDRQLLHFLIPFYLQAVHVHSANGGTLRKA
jgi:hypothetical protein